MEANEGESGDRASLMTLHAAKGLEFDTVFLPGWEEGLFPNQRALDESGRAGLEEERRLAHVGLTRARARAKLYFASNRRIHGLWSSTVPSRFIDELPPGSVEVTEAPAAYSYAGYGSRFEHVAPFGSSYATPGWQRAQANRAAAGGDFRTRLRRGRAGPARRRSAARADRGRAGRALDRRGLGFRGRRPRPPPEIWPRHRGGGGREQAHGGFRPGGAEDGVGQFCGEAGVAPSPSFRGERSESPEPMNTIGSGDTRGRAALF